MNRFLWVVGGDTRRLRLAALFQFTLPDPPIVYYGTEVGRSQDRDVRSADGSGHPEESRLPMPWGDDQDTDLLAWYRELVALRRATPGRWAGRAGPSCSTTTRAPTPCRIGDDAESAVVVLNLSAQPRRVVVPDRSGLHVALATDEGVEDDGVTLDLPGYAGAVLA